MINQPLLFTYQYFSYMIASLSSWLFFVLIQAYYGGALTMFFTSEIPIPFNNIYDVMKDYPTWNLRMRAGNEALFQYKALEGDEEYAKFYDRIINKPQEAKFQTIPEALDYLAAEPTVIHLSQGALYGHFKSYPFWQQKVKLFDRSRADYRANVYPKNSPLVPMTRYAFDQLREGGMIEYLSIKWKGNSLPNMESADLIELSAGQTLLIFILMGSALALTSLILCFEFVHKRLLNRKPPKRRSKKRKKRPKRNQHQEVASWVHSKMIDIE